MLQQMYSQLLQLYYRNYSNQAASSSLNSLEIDDDVYFRDCGFIGDKTSVTNDKSVDINFTVKEEQSQHIKFTIWKLYLRSSFVRK